MTLASLADCDLRDLVSVIEDGRRDDPGPAMPWATLVGLSRLIRCDVLTFNELEPATCRAVVGQGICGGEADAVFDEVSDTDDPFWRYYWDTGGCGYHERTGDTRPVRMSDLYTLHQRQTLPALADSLRYRISVPLASRSGISDKICMWRDSGSDFTDRDVLILTLLRPHLHDVYRDARRRRNGIPRLTRREYDVLQLAANGSSNHDIAARLCISVSTVRKHLEHIFDRTGTRTRAGAAAIALPQPDRPGQSVTGDAPPATDG